MEWRLQLAQPPFWPQERGRSSADGRNAGVRCKVDRRTYPFPEIETCRCALLPSSFSKPGRAASSHTCPRYPR
eukprot:1418165-Rhodomonas_salina.1